MTAVAISPVDAIRDRVRDAAARRAPLRIAGRGRWLDAGRPVSSIAEPFSLAELTGIVEYVPGDLTLTARAATPLDEIAAATAPHGQWLALDPHGGDGGTIGATVATGSSGPLTTGFGTPRDLMLGLEFITGAGVVARGGGRVVKNVAGFDLVRLLTGSWGTLGVITEVTLRLHARPAVEESLAIELPDARGGILRAGQVMRALPFVPYACELVSAGLSRALGASPDAALLVRLGGNRDAVAAQRAALGALGPTRPLDPEAWTRLRGAEPTGAFTLRWSDLPTKLADTWTAASEALADCPGALLHATVARGIVRAIVPPDAAGAAAVERAARAAFAGARVGERLPAAAWAALRSPTDDQLSRAIKARFDPSTVLNPGIFGEVV